MVKTFKKMKDYILGNQDLIGQRDIMQITMQSAENKAEISRLRMDLGSVEKQMSDVMDQLSDVVTKSDLADMMNSFVNDEDNGCWIRNIVFNFPMPVQGQEIKNLSLEPESTVETVVLLSRVK